MSGLDSGLSIREASSAARIGGAYDVLGQCPESGQDFTVVSVARLPFSVTDRGNSWAWTGTRAPQPQIPRSWHASCEPRS